MRGRARIRREEVASVRRAMFVKRASLLAALALRPACFLPARTCAPPALTHTQTGRRAPNSLAFNKPTLACRPCALAQVRHTHIQRGPAPGTASPARRAPAQGGGGASHAARSPPGPRLAQQPVTRARQSREGRQAPRGHCSGQGPAPRAKPSYLTNPPGPARDPSTGPLPARPRRPAGPGAAPAHPPPLVCPYALRVR